MRKTSVSPILSRLKRSAAHMTQSSRRSWRSSSKSSRFLVDGPRGSHELTSDLRNHGRTAYVWLLQDRSACKRSAVSEVLIQAARGKRIRRCLLLLGDLDTPGLAEACSKR